jgi:hypothetical protein
MTACSACSMDRLSVSSVVLPGGSLARWDVVCATLCAAMTRPSERIAGKMARKARWPLTISPLATRLLFGWRRRRPIAAVVGRSKASPLRSIAQTPLASSWKLKIHSRIRILEAPRRARGRMAKVHSALKILRPCRNPNHQRRPNGLADEFPLFNEPGLE